MLPRFRSLALLTLAAALSARFAAGAPKPIPVKVVVVAMFEPGEDTGDRAGEFQYWVEREKLERVLAFPAGKRPLRMNKDGSILGVVTGPGVTNATSSIMALGMDPRFDLSKAYWLVAGIAGVDPEDASIGSAAWASYVVESDLVYEVDAREAPADWPYSRLAIGAKRPNTLPGPRDANLDGLVFPLNKELAGWAFALTKDTPLGDTAEMAEWRGRYAAAFPNAGKPPFVLQGDSLGGSTYWHGRAMTRWANDWVKMWTANDGNYVMTNLEDNGTAMALTRLTRIGRADFNRLLVLRTGSNYCMPPPGVAVVESMTAPYAGRFPSLDAAHRVGSRVVHALIEGWAKWRVAPPTRSAMLPR